MRSERAAAFFGANSSRPTGSFRQRQKTQKVYTMCSAQSVYHVPVLTGTHADARRTSDTPQKTSTRSQREVPKAAAFSRKPTCQVQPADV